MPVPVTMPYVYETADIIPHIIASTLFFFVMPSVWHALWTSFSAAYRCSPFPALLSSSELL